MGEGGATESLLLVGKLESLVGGFLLLFCSGTRSRKDELNYFFRGSVSGVPRWRLFFFSVRGLCVLVVESLTAGHRQ